MQERVMNRWLVVIGAIIIQMCLGAIYAWSAFTKHLTAPPFTFSATQTQVIFSVALGTFAAFTIIAGRLQGRLGPRNCARLGGALLALGYILAWAFQTSFVGMVIAIGLIGGAGIGLAYVVPIAVGVKWFPDKKGLITGLAVAGFGFGALLWVQLASSWSAGPLAWTGLLERFGVSNVFLIYGVVFLVFVLLGSTWMVNPPQGWTPPGWSAKSTAAGRAGEEFESGEMLGTHQFWLMWIMYTCGALAGLMVIGIIKLFGVDALQARSGMSEAAAAGLAATAMGVFFAIFNGVGRIAWGTISDTIGRKAALTLMLALQGAIVFTFYYAGGYVVGLFVGAACIGFNFGGTLALFPAATADYFGNKNVGKNYGWLFTAYGVGGIVGPIMAGWFRDAARHAVAGAATQSDKLAAALAAWQTPFIIAGAACLVAAAIGLVLRHPHRKTAPIGPAVAAGIAPAR